MLVSSILIGYRCHQKMPPASDRERCAVRLETRTPARLGSRSFRYSHFALSELDLCGFFVPLVSPRNENRQVPKPSVIFSTRSESKAPFSLLRLSLLLLLLLLCFGSFVFAVVIRRVVELTNQNDNTRPRPIRPTDKQLCVANRSISPTPHTLHRTPYT